MEIREALQKLEFGNSVAEYDKGLENYFLVTQSYLALIHDDVDIITGDKGTGKTAIYQYLKKHHKNEPALSNTAIVPGFNPSGEPIFRKLGLEHTLSEAQYIAIWKLYILALAGNWLLNNSNGRSSKFSQKLEEVLNELNLRNRDGGAQSAFSNVINIAKRMRPKFSTSIDVTGTTSYQLGLDLADTQPQKTTNHEDLSQHDLFQLLDNALKDQNKNIWIIIDRLDEAFIGFPDVERPALRALFRTYLDLMEFETLRLKLFTRNDLFRKIIGDGFVNLTHINARKFEIIWDDEDLIAMLANRIFQNREFLQLFGMDESDRSALFELIFPRRIETGKKHPDALNWILAQIKDGNGTKSPRNLIDLMRFAKEEQYRREQRNARKFSTGISIFEAETIKTAHKRMSKMRVGDTLLAEYGPDVQRAVGAFESGKSEYNETAIRLLFGVEAAEARTITKILTEIGLFEKQGDCFKIPLLYQPGLSISIGKAGRRRSSEQI